MKFRFLSVVLALAMIISVLHKNKIVFRNETTLFLIIL